MATEVLRPALSPTMTEGKIARWLKTEGEPVRAGDVLGAFGDHDPGKDTLVDRFDLHRRFVGLDFSEHVAGPDGLTLGF